MRKLVTLQKIKDLLPIPGAEKIELALLENKAWKVVVAKGLHQKGDIIIFCEIDSLLPIRPEFEFLRPSSYTTEFGAEGFRLITIELRKQISQGLILPLDILKNFEQAKQDTDLFLGNSICIKEDAINNKDLTEILGIRLAEKEIDMSAIDLIKGAFPADISKTTIERIQNIPQAIRDYAGKVFIETEKLDGGSSTYFLKPVSDDITDLKFGVCSKTVEMILDEKNPYGKYALDNKLEEKFRSLGEVCVLQGEYLPKQGYYDLSEPTVYFFRKFNPLSYQAESYEQFKETTERLGLKTVPIINENYIMPNTVDELLKEANGMSILNPKRKREGIVLTLKENPNVWIKIISNKKLIEDK